jgi:lipoyl-dependent peroxiredoxin
MADIQRTADAVWQGDLRGGKGQISTGSGVLNTNAYGFTTRFENEAGTNPEELVAAAHAACFSMNLSGVLGKNGFKPERIQTHALLSMEKQDVGFVITKIRLEVEGRVPDIDQTKFQQLAEEAEKTCPISRLLRPGLNEVEVVARLG